MSFFCFLIISIILSYGMAIAIVEKGNQYPIRYYKLKLRKFIRLFSRRFDKVLSCTTCSSFWTALISDLLLCCISSLFFGITYFFWPLSGFIAMGFTWTIIEYLNSRDE